MFRCFSVVWKHVFLSYVSDMLQCFPWHTEKPVLVLVARGRRGKGSMDGWSSTNTYLNRWMVFQGWLPGALTLGCAQSGDSFHTSFFEAPPGGSRSRFGPPNGLKNRQKSARNLGCFRDGVLGSIFLKDSSWFLVRANLGNQCFSLRNNRISTKSRSSLPDQIFSILSSFWLRFGNNFTKKSQFWRN